MSKPERAGPSAAITSRARAASVITSTSTSSSLEQVDGRGRRLEAGADVGNVLAQNRAVVGVQRVGAGDLEVGAGQPEPDAGRGRGGEQRRDRVLAGAPNRRDDGRGHRGAITSTAMVWPG